MSNLKCCTCCDGHGNGLGLAVVPISQLCGLLDFRVEGVTGIVSLTVPGGGRFYYDIWMSESQDSPTETLAPVRHDALHWRGITDADGKAEFRFQYKGIPKSLCPWGWIVRVAIGGMETIGIIPSDEED